MPSWSLLLILTVIFLTPFTAAVPQLSDATSKNPTVFYAWSSDPVCVSKACVADCQAAAEKVCSSSNLATTVNATVGDCTAFYWYDIGNTIATKETCLSAYNYINNAAQPDADGCGGTIGGALGYDKNGNRTIDPLFAVYPRDGNANCFKAPGDTSPVKARDELPNGQRLPMDSCPDATNRRRLRALQRLDKRWDVSDCLIEDVAWQAACNAVCLTEVTASTWWTGPFMAAGWLSCLGMCDATGFMVFERCDHKKQPRSLGQRAARVPSNPCSNIMGWAFQCQAWQNGLLSAHSCPGSTQEDLTTVAPERGGAINY